MHDLRIRDHDVLKSLSFPSMLDRRSNIDRPHEGTCQWITDLPQYQNWQSAERGLLWVKGHPGSGKSTMMSHLYELLRENERGQNHFILNFFCSARGTELQHSPYGLFRSLLNQLFDQVKSSRPVVRDVFSSKHKAHGYDLTLWSWQESEVKDLFTRALLSSDTDVRLTIFIDALDELGEIASRNMSRHCHLLNDKCDKSGRRVKFCISSRHYPIVSAVPGIEIWMEQHNNKDIATFIADHLDPNIWRETQQSSTAAEKLEKDLLIRAHGIFQWVRLVIPMIEKMLLDGEPISEVQAWMRQIPTELGQVYDHIVRNVISHRNLQQTSMLFQWVLLAQIPLKLRELRYALACSPSLELHGSVACEKTQGFIDSDIRMAQRVKALSGGLIEIITTEVDSRIPYILREGEVKAQIVQVVHQSVSDYFLDSGLQLLVSLQAGNAAKSIGHPIPMRGANLIRRCHLNLHRCCLNYISQVQDEGDALLKHVVHSPGKIWPTWPFLAYATLHLFSHASKVSSFPDGELHDQVGRLQDILETWKLTHRHINLEVGWPRIQLASTLLHVAAIADLADIASYMISSGHDANKMASGDVPLQLAARMGNLRTAKALHAGGARFDVINSYTGFTPLRHAVLGGFKEFVTWLMSQSVPVHENFRVKLESLLEVSVAQGDINIVRLLIQRLTVTVEQPDLRSELSKALLVAVHKCRTDLADLLLRNGADSNHNNLLQKAFLHHDRNMAKLLLQYHADPRNLSYGEKSLIEMASEWGDLEVIRALLAAGAPIVMTGKPSNRPLQTAIAKNNIALFRLLFNHRCAGYEPKDHLNASLHMAAQLGRMEILEVLLQAGGDVNCGLDDYRRCSVLENAIISCSAEIVKRVLKAGARPLVRQFMFRLVSARANHRNSDHYDSCDWTIYDSPDNPNSGPNTLKRIPPVFDYAGNRWYELKPYDMNAEQGLGHQRICEIVRLMRDVQSRESHEVVSGDPEVYIYNRRAIPDLETLEVI